MSAWSSVFLAELLKLWSRGMARAGAVLFLVIGVLAPLALRSASSSVITVNDQDATAFIDVSAPNAVLWSLYLRNFFVSHVLLAVLAAMSFAGELRDHTLREDLVRPVPRALVLAAKWGALCAWIGGTLLAQLLVATLTGLVLHPNQGEVEFGEVLLGFLASGVCDAGFAAFALAAAVVVRSVSGALTTIVLFLVFEWVASWAPSTLEMFAQAMDPVPPVVQFIIQSGPFFPSAAWGAWQELATNAVIHWEPWAALALYTAAAAVIAERTFSQIDVP